LFLAGLALAVIGAVIGYRRGFYAMWATTFNVIVSIYIAIMLTPTLSSKFNLLGSGLGNVNNPTFWYIYACCVAVTAFLIFMVLEIIAMTYFTGAFNITLPGIFENIGASGLGFLTGYVTWGFICFVVLIMPFSQDRLITKAFTADTTSRQISAPAISKLLNTTNVFSWQPNSNRVSNVISWTLGWTEDGSEPNNLPRSINSDPNFQVPDENTIQI